jgi:hypothetical protein
LDVQSQAIIEARFIQHFEELDCKPEFQCQRNGGKQGPPDELAQSIDILGRLCFSGPENLAVYDLRTEIVKFFDLSKYPRSFAGVRSEEIRCAGG